MQSARQVQGPESSKTDHVSNIKINNVAAFPMIIDTFMCVLYIATELLSNIHEHRRDLEIVLLTGKDFQYLEMRK